MKKKLCAVFTVAVLALGSIGLFAACGGAKDLADAEITLSQTEYVYDGSAHCPEVAVAFGDTQVESTELAVAYSNNINAGTATVTVTPSAKSAYVGSISADYTILKAQSMVAEEVHLTAEYKQTLGEVLGSKYNVASKDLVTGEELSADTVLTNIGEDAYKFTSLFTPDDANYDSANQTVFVTVTKATPDSAKDLSALKLTANLGDAFSVIADKLPEGIVVKEAENVFTQAGKKSVAVVAKQPDGAGGYDTEHYTAPELSVSVQVAYGELDLNGYKFLYESTAFAAGEAEGTYTVDGSVMLDGQFDMFQDWTVSVTFSFEKLKQLNINAVFDNIADKALLDNTKKVDFRFDKGTCESWLGSILNGTGNRFDYVPDGKPATDTLDHVYLPEYEAWNSIKITVKSWLLPEQVTRRHYEIYMGDGTSEADGTLLFRRYTDRTNPYRLQFIFERAEGVEITNLSYTASAYGTNKLFAANNKMAQFISEGTTIAEEYTQGGLMMLGDSLVDYWATDFDKTWLESMHATEAIWKNIGFEGPVMNFGVGSSTAEGWLNYLEYGKEYFAQFNPDVVFMLIGCNEINFEDGLNISKYVIEMIKTVRGLYPNATILVNSMMPTATTNGRWKNWNRLADANDLIEAYIGESEDESLFFLDFENLFTPDRTKPVSDTNAPIASYHVTDGLHFNTSAYEIWTREIMDFLAEQGIVTDTEITLNVVNEDGSTQDISGCVKWDYTAYNGHLVITLEVDSLQLFEDGVLYDEIFFELVSIKLGETDVTAQYDAKNKLLVLDLEEEAESETLTVTVKSVENPDDNVTDDKDFETGN